MPSQICLFFIGYKLKEAELQDFAIVSGILKISDDFFTAEVRSKYQTNVRRVEEIKKDKWVDTYLYRKQRIHSSR